MQPVIKTILRPVERFLALESASGILLGGCTVLAMALANSGYGPAYLGLLHAQFLALSVQHWINDGLMTVFFFVVGMEIKRELVRGELASPRQAALPIAAALGGMVVPALIYFILNPAAPGASGWGIPMATDIAFAVGVLGFFRVPLALKVFLLALAIVDDLGAVLVIAFFYSAGIKGWALGLAGLGIGAMALARLAGVRSYAIYVLLGISVWLAVLQSGVHATVAGVLIGVLTPLTYPGPDGNFSPLEDLVRRLHPWVSFGIMPIFALANAGVDLRGADFAAVAASSIHQGVALGLFFGKPVGITLACALSVALGFAKLPTGVRWANIFAVACLGGVGFTMALFISSLALAPELEIFSKTGIVVGSAASTLAGAAALAFAARLKS